MSFYSFHLDKKALNRYDPGSFGYVLNTNDFKLALAFTILFAYPDGRRAKAAFDYAVSKGIDSKRILYQGFGETRLLNNCANGVNCTEEQHEVNRRSIVKVVRKGEYKGKRGQRNVFYF